MKNLYNVALIPRSEKNSVIKCSQCLSSIADSYLLGDNSLPHVTIYKFEASESDIKLIWEEVCNKLDPTSVELSFNKFSCITFDEKIFWASLLPDNIDVLMKMHAVVAEIIKQPIKPNFDPHMT